MSLASDTLVMRAVFFPHMLVRELWFGRSMMLINLGAVWFTKCNVKGNGNGLPSITDGNKFE
jgi:hypothetical protein